MTDFMAIFYLLSEFLPEICWGTPFMLCVLILYISGGSYNLKSTPNDRFHGNFLLTLRVFARNLMRANRQRNIFHISFWCLTWHLNLFLMSNKLTHYLLDYVNFLLYYNEKFCNDPRIWWDHIEGIFFLKKKNWFSNFITWCR